MRVRPSWAYRPKDSKEYKAWYKHRLNEARKVAKKYKRRGHFQLNEKKLYAWSYSQGILDEICAHMKDSRQDRIWSKQKIKKEAKKYKLRGEFQRKSNSAYITAYNKGWLDEVCAHMPKPKSWIKKKIDEDKIIDLALSYPKWSDFTRENMGAYHALTRHNKKSEIKQLHKAFYGDESLR